MRIGAGGILLEKAARTILWDLTETKRRELATEIERQEGLARITADVAFKHLGYKPLEYEVRGENSGEVTKMKFEVAAVQENPSDPCSIYDLVYVALDTLTTDFDVEVPLGIIYMPQKAGFGENLLMTSQEFGERFCRVVKFACHAFMGPGASGFSGDDPSCGSSVADSGTDIA